jgi:hypothetical protein
MSDPERGGRNPVPDSQASITGAAFQRSRALLDTVTDWLGGGASAQATHAELEAQLQTRGRDVLRQLLQDHLDLRAAREVRLAGVSDADGVDHRYVESGHDRGLATVLGPVSVTRIAYRARGATNLYPADAALGLPEEKHSHGLRRLTAIEATRGSFDAAVEAVQRATGVLLGKRQAQELTVRAATDIEDFYTARAPQQGTDADVLVLSCDAKGIVMRPEALRQATAKAATSRKLSTRLSKGEQRHRKRMAEVGAVYDAAPVVRTPADIIATATSDQPPRPAQPGPTARGKWLTASVTAEAADVIAAVFDEATRRDPDHRRTWVALVDGNNHQIERINAQAADHDTRVHIIIDFIHVIEYLWKAAWCFWREGDKAAEKWVAGHAHAILAGRASTAAAAIRRKATYHNLAATQRKNADTAAAYLLNKRPYLDYRSALANGWPIATGVIEGACRHLVKDRMDITGARWGLDRAEAILKLRALTSNGDFDAYWTYHLAQEQQRTHHTRYLGGVIPS